MAGLQIACPKCGKTLKLPDRSLLGRRGKCAKCGHAFILEEPDEVQLELAEPVAKQPPAGTSARWIPDQNAAVPAAYPGQIPMPLESEMLATTLRRKSRSRGKAKQMQMTIAVVGALVLLIGGSAVAFRGALFGSSSKSNGKSVTLTKRDAKEVDDEPAWEAPLPIRPTKGEPIELLCMPYGVTAVVHLRPADLWTKGSKEEEFRYCWGPLGEWLEKNIQDVCLFEPVKIEEVTFGLLPGKVGEEMQVAALVRLKEAQQKADLIKLLKSKGEYNDSGEYPVYVGDQYAYVLKDLRTLALAPRMKQVELVESVNRANAQSPGLEALLKNTDRQRQIVLMFEPAVLGAHLPFILPQELHTVGDYFLEFFNAKKVESVAWSLHVGEKFHSEMLLRNKSSISRTGLQHEMKQKLDKLPNELLAAVRKMDPKQVGPRQIVGRFPAMMKVFSLATSSSSGDRYATLTTSLPERAAPNLAIGTLLTWDESTRTDFRKSAVTDKPKETGKLPDLVADRLKQFKIEIEFNRTPLQDAFKFIADECKVTIEIDGDALKDAGFTKNMPQNMTLGKVTGLEGIAGILKKYANEAKPLVLVIDEAKKRALITTKTFAEKDNLKVVELP